MKFVHEGKIAKGKFVPDDREFFIFSIETLEGKNVDVSVSRRRNKMSQKQRGWVFGVAYKMIGKEVGESDIYKVHRMMMGKLRPEQVDYVNLKTGERETVIVGGSSKEYDTIEAVDYKEDLQRWAAEFLGVVIPDPKQVVVEKE